MKINMETNVTLSFIGTFGDKFINSNTPQVYSNIGLNNVRVYMDNTGQYWFIGKEVTEMLGYSNSFNAIDRHVSSNNKILYHTKLINQLTPVSGVSPHSSNILIVTEQGLYELILGSNLPNSDIFRQYVFDLLHKIKEYGDPYENKIPIVDIIPQTARKYIQNRYNQKIDNIEKMHKQEIDNISSHYVNNITEFDKQWKDYHNYQKQMLEYNHKQEMSNCNNYYKQVLSYGAYQYDMLRMDSMNKDKRINDLEQELSITKNRLSNTEQELAQNKQELAQSKQEFNDFKMQANMILNTLMEEFNKRNNINQINKPKPITTIDIG